MGIALRPLTKADIPDLARHFAAVEAVDDSGEHYDEADLEEEFDNPDIEVGKDLVGAFDDVELVGFFSVMASRSTERRKAYAYGSTLPSRRGEGVGTLLCEGMLARTDEIRASRGGPLRVLCSGVAGNDPQAALLKGFGLAPERWQFAMRRELADVQPGPDFPAGYTVRRYTPQDADRWRRAHNRAFRDHPDSNEWAESEWQQWVVGNRSFRPEVTFLVTPQGDDTTIASYLTTKEFDATTAVTGKREAYIDKLGTLPEHRGRGLASTLLRYSLAAQQAAGYDEAALDVDSLNPTGALGIYEAAGFAKERTFATYVTVLA